MNILITEHKSQGQLKAISTAVRVFVNDDLNYGYFVDEHKLFALLTPEQQTSYLQGSDAKLDVTPEVAQQIIDMGSAPYAKVRVYRTPPQESFQSA